MRHIKKFSLAIVVAAVIWSCDIIDEKNPDETVRTGDLDASRIVAMGNSLTAGIIDGGWTYDGLRHSYATQIARQIYGDGRVGDDPMEHQFLLGKIKEPGNPVPAEIIATEQVGEYEDGTPVLRYEFTPPENIFTSEALRAKNAEVDSNYNNLSVPGFMGLDVLQTHTTINVLGQINPLFSIPLRDRGPQLEQALEIDPTLVILWVGNNEVLGAALSGGITPPYPLEDVPIIPVPGFKSVLEDLLKPFEDTNTKIILGTVPDVTSIPFVTEVGVIKSDGTRGFIFNQSGEGSVWQDTLTFYGTTPEGEVRAIRGSENILLDWLFMDPLNDNLPMGLDASNPLDDELWLTDSQKAEIARAISGYNEIIKSAGQSDNIAVADMNTFYDQIAEEGIDGFEPGLFGGLFSLDGVHPSRMGHAYIANEFIKVLNEEFGAQIAMLDPGIYNPEGLPQGMVGLVHGQKNPAYQQSKWLILNSDQGRLP
ncbi:MAG: SGNH/GDSL hydrolase family protein [Balneolales bacterium]